MRRMEAIRRVEELTYQVEALTRENTKLRVQVCDTREEASRVAEDLLASQAEVSSLNAQIEAMREEAAAKYAKIGNLIKDNARLLRINTYLVETLSGERPAPKNVAMAANKYTEGAQ